MQVRFLILALIFLAAPVSHAEAEPGAARLRILDQVRALSPLQTIIVAHDREILAERGYRGHSTRSPTNITSASKSVVSALVSIAIDRGVLKGPDQAVAPLLEPDLPADPDPRIFEITLGHLLSMQAGLQSAATRAPARTGATSAAIRAAPAYAAVGHEAGPQRVSDYPSKKAKVRTSMLSRGGASSEMLGSANAACSEKRVRPSVAES